MRPFIPTTFYAIIQYIGSIVLISSPWLFGFDNVGGASLFIPILMGVFLLLIAVFSDNKLGFIQVFPMQMNLFLAMMAGFLLLVGPGLYGFYDEIWAPHVILGGLFFFCSIFTQNSPFTTQPHEMMHEGQLGSTDAHEGRLMV